MSANAQSERVILQPTAAESASNPREVTPPSNCRLVCRPPCLIRLMDLAVKDNAVARKVTDRQIQFARCTCMQGFDPVYAANKMHISPVNVSLVKANVALESLLTSHWK